MLALIFMASVAIKKEEQGNYQIPVQRGLQLCASVERPLNPNKPVTQHTPSS